MNPKYNPIFRRSVTTVSILALLASSAPYIGTSWAWFTDNKTAGVSSIQAATFQAEVTITDQIGNPVYPGSDGKYTLTKDQTYTVILKSGASTASYGYCLIEADEMIAYTGDIPSATYTEMIGEETIFKNGYRFFLKLGEKIDVQPAPTQQVPGEGQEENGEADDGQLDDQIGNQSDDGQIDDQSGDGQTDDQVDDQTDDSQTDDQVDDQTDDSQTDDQIDDQSGDGEESDPPTLQVHFTSIWGSRSNGASTFGFFSDPVIENGSTVNEWGEPIQEKEESEETTPEETTPEETTPEETSPEETTPEETSPEETSPEETSPEETSPEETSPEETSPEETSPEETSPEETTPEETSPEETSPEETSPSETAPDVAVPDVTVPNTTTGSGSHDSMTDTLELDDEDYEDEFPIFYQNDYPDNRYGSGSIKSDGCGIVALSMVASYITDHEYTPDVLARWFGGRAENNIKRMEIGAETLGLTWFKADNIDKATTELMDGKLGILMLDGQEGQTHFTTSQHFVVIRGMTEDGKYLIVDPNEDNYDHWALKKGFEQGFDRSDFVSAYSGCWIFDPELPEDFEPYVKDEPARRDNYPGVDLTFEEQELICKIIWAEARGECAEGQQAIAEIILNRLVSGKFGSSVESVIYSPGQFSTVEKIPEATPWQAQYDALDAARFSAPVLNKNVFYFGTTPHNDNLYGKIENHYFCYAPDAAPANPAVNPPAPTQPAATEPVVTEPVVTEPPVTEPVVTEPVVTEPPVTEPAVTEPVVTEPRILSTEPATEPVTEPATNPTLVTEGTEASAE